MTSTTFNTYVGAKIRELRHTKGLTQLELAKVLGITFQQLQKYEKGINLVSLEKMLILASYLGVGLEYFLPGTVGEKREGIVDITDRKGGELLKLYNNIKSPEHRKMCLEVVKMLHDKDQSKYSEAS
jgi:transcriptional regulator with XRE-family HTH domain